MPDTFVPATSDFGAIVEVDRSFTVWLGFTAAAVATLGLKSVVFSPCANRPAEGDWLGVMKANIERMEAMLKN